MSKNPNPVPSTVVQATESPQDLSNILGSEIVWTPEVELFGRQVGKWMSLELPGAYVFGVQRSGKSAALAYLSREIEQFVGQPVFVSIVNIERGLADRETSLVAEWLGQENVLSNTNSPARLRKALREHFMEQTRQRETDRVLIVIDEAQNATRMHLGQILALGNVLSQSKERRLRVFTLLVGQPELRAFVDSYVTMNELQLVGRFFERKWEFVGIAPGDIPLVLKAYEMDVVCSDGSVQPPAVAALFPQAWQDGWRPNGWATVIAEGIGNVAARCGLPREQRIPMQHLRSTLLGVLAYAKALGDPHTPIPVEVVEQALTETGLNETWGRYAAMVRK